MANQTTSARTIRKIHPPRVIVIASLHARHRGRSLPRMIAGAGNHRQRNWQRADGYPSRMKVTSMVARYSVIFPFSTRAFCSTRWIPVTPLRVLLARLRAAFTASCQPRGEGPMILVTRATAMALPPPSEWGIGGHCRWEGDACQGARPTKNPPRAWPLRGGFHPYLVEGKGFEPSTSALRTPRSPN